MRDNNANLFSIASQDRTKPMDENWRSEDFRVLFREIIDQEWVCCGGRSFLTRGIATFTSDW